MAKSKIQEVLTLKIEGSLNLDTMQIEIEEIGNKDIKELLRKFDSEYITFSVKLGNEITE